MKYLKYFEDSDKFLFDYEKLKPEVKAKLPYKEGDYVEVHVGYNGERPTGRPDDIHDIMQIVYIRKNEDDENVTYAVHWIGYPDDNYFECDEYDIIRKVEDYEVDALKYNI